MQADYRAAYRHTSMHDKMAGPETGMGCAIMDCYASFEGIESARVRR